MPLDHIKRLRAAFPNALFYSMYGQTECLRVTYLPPDQLDKRPTSVGKGMPNQELWIEDETGRRAGPGAAGELVVSGPHVMKGYWESPEDTDKKLRPGPRAGEKVLHTGDLFKMDEEGYLYFVSRQDDIIKCRGEKVSPREVEDILCAHPDVAEAAVVGMPDPVLGQCVCAAVVVRDGARVSPPELIAYSKKHLEDFMVPKSVVFATGGLPKSPNGKIDKRSLAGLFKEVA
jgi:acyl-CoA synthetase (AMP-forming)/AMP-acid ligase II